MLERSNTQSSAGSLQELWNKGTAEYKALLKLFIEAKARMNRQCGCSEEKVIELEEKLKDVNALVKQKTIEVQNIQTNIRNKNEELKNLENEKERLFAEQSDEIKKLANIDNNSINTDEILHKKHGEL